MNPFRIVRDFFREVWPPRPDVVIIGSVPPTTPPTPCANGKHSWVTKIAVEYGYDFMVIRECSKCLTEQGGTLDAVGFHDRPLDYVKLRMQGRIPLKPLDTSTIGK